MSELIQKLRCFLGLHYWEEWENFGAYMVYECKRCGTNKQKFIYYNE
ncbi:hypothetical protein GWN42_24100 [candidate division KSB1 bacterium]|nr:hypothetical protein [candidate division KSB1 bacterium]